MISAKLVDDQDEIMLITDAGTLVRTRAAEISVVGRNTQGVRLINMNKDEKLIGMERIEESASTDDSELDADNVV